MLTYEYECESCGKRFEAEQRITDVPLKECIFCGGDVRRVVSAGVGILLNSKDGACTERCSVPPCGQDHGCCGSDRASGDRPCCLR